MRQSFWSRFYKEYISLLQKRPKWFQKQPNLEIGSLVLIKEDGVLPLKWILARISKLIKDKNNIARSAIVKTQKGEFTRPITKLCVLPIDVEIET